MNKLFLALILLSPLTAKAWAPWGTVEAAWLFNSNLPSHVDATGPNARYKIKMDVYLPLIWDLYLKVGARGVSSDQSFNQGGGAFTLGYKLTNRFTVGIFHESMHNFDYVPTDRPYKFTSENQIFVRYRFGGEE